MNVQVRLFAAARELVGAGSLDQTLSDGATVQDLIEALCKTYPDLRAMRLRFAVNASYAGSERVLCEGDEVACIPPVGGG